MIAERSSNVAYELRAPFVRGDLREVDNGQVGVGH